MCVCACVYFTSYSYNIAAFVIVNIELIRRQCVYDGVSTYWYPDSSTMHELCPNGTQRVSGIIASQVRSSKIKNIILTHM